MKTEVYSWRLSTQRKAELESEARREGTSLAELLNTITANWLEKQRDSRNEDEAEQAAILKRVMSTVGTVRTGDPALSTRAGEIVRERILQRHLKESRGSRRSD